MPIADTSVRTYLSTMTGAPTLSGTAGTLITLLDNCLINGFGSVTLSSLVVASNVATATVNTGHGFSMIGGSGGVGPVIRIAGATPSALNRDWRIASVPNSTTFTFVTADISDQTATGTITVKIAPADWTKRFSGTNKAAYARTDEDATAMLLRVDDTGTTTAQVRGYEEMTGIDTGAGLFPTIAQVAAASGLWWKSSAANATAQAWVLMADGFRLAFFPMPTAASFRHPYLWGDLLTNITGDAYHCVLSTAQDAGDYPCNSVFYRDGSTYPAYIARAYSQIGSAVAIKLPAVGITGCLGVLGVCAYPNNGRLLLRGELEYLEVSSLILRGRWPGVYPPIHAKPMTDLDVVANVSGMPVMALRICSTNSKYSAGDCDGRVFVNLLDWS
jgi:hypothetical protein